MINHLNAFSTSSNTCLKALDYQAKIQEKDTELLQCKNMIQDQMEELHFYSAAYDELQQNYDQLLAAFHEAKNDLALRDAVLAEYQQQHAEVR